MSIEQSRGELGALRRLGAERHAQLQLALELHVRGSRWISRSPRRIDAVVRSEHQVAGLRADVEPVDAGARARW